jgi:signal transduction histidine kinase/ligand-binding sensor domain-containing protein
MILRGETAGERMMIVNWMLAAALAASSPDVSGSAAAKSVATTLPATPYFRTLSVTDGLPSNHVYKIVEDRQGFLWIGTHDGLARYDGVSVRVWQHDASDADSIGSNEVQAVYVDRDNRIWCGGDNGISVLDRGVAGGNRFAHFRHAENDAGSLSTNDIWAIAGDADGGIWAGGYGGGLERLDPASGKIAHLRKMPGDTRGLASEHVLALTFDRAGRLWIGSDVGIDVRLPDATIRHVDLSAIAGDGRFNATGLVEDADGSMLSATRHGLVRIGTDFKGSLVASDGLTDKFTYSVVRDDAGDLWIGSRHGLNRMQSNGRLDGYRESAALPGSFPGETAFDALRDREGGLWFATFEGGVARLPAQWRNFSLYRNDPANAASLGSNRVQGMAEDADGALWAVNSNGGIERIDAASGQAEHLDARLSVPDKALWSVLPDRSGQLWVGHTRGLRVYNLQSGKFQDLPVDGSKRDALAPGMVQQLVQSSSGAIWASSFGGAMQRIDPGTHAIERFDEENSGLRSTEIDQIGFANDGALIVAGGAGLDRFDTTTQHFAPVPSMQAARVMEFAWAADGSLWLHRPGALERWREHGDAWELAERVDAKAGWAALSVGGMQVDGDGRVWVSSPRGLWRYDPASHAIRRFGVHDGLASAEFSRMPLLKRGDGTVFGSTLAGIVGFAPSRIADNVVAPPLVLDEITVRRDGHAVALPADAQRLTLAWDDSDLRIRAVALSWANTESIRYQWRMDDVETGWIDSGNRGEREYSQLPAGSHELRLRAANASGVWTELPPLRFDQSAPPWATGWAYAAYVFIVLLAAIWSLQLYRRRLKRRYTWRLAEQRREFAEQASAAKTEFLATMGHEIRTPMTGVLGMAELLLRTPLETKQRGYAEAILSSGQMMLRMVNDSLDLARIEAGKLELEEAPLDLHALFGEVAALAQPLAAKKGLGFAHSIGADAPRNVLGDAVRIKQVFLNLVNNAIKFTERGSVTIALERAESGAVQFSVRDTGPGIAASTRARLFQRFEQAEGTQQRNGGSGLGLAICRELVARMGGDITLDSVEGEGSTFRVALPLVESAEKDTSAQPAVALTVAGSHGLHVLLVEDDATVAAVIAGQLEAQGHCACHVENGLAALAEIDTAPFDAALLDLDLPGIDGLALARMLRARETRKSLPRLPLIGISARSVGDEEALCLAAGMDAFLRKPILGNALRDCLERLLHAQR